MNREGVLVGIITLALLAFLGTAVVIVVKILDSREEVVVPFKTETIQKIRESDAGYEIRVTNEKEFERMYKETKKNYYRPFAQ